MRIFIKRIWKTVLQETLSIYKITPHFEQGFSSKMVSASNMDELSSRSFPNKLFRRLLTGSRQNMESRPSEKRLVIRKNTLYIKYRPQFYTIKCKMESWHNTDGILNRTKKRVVHLNWMVNTNRKCRMDVLYKIHDVKRIWDSESNVSNLYIHTHHLLLKISLDLLCSWFLSVGLR